MSAVDPLHAVFAALDAHGCEPRGPEHKFTARCPAHDDRSPSLSVSVGVDGRALVWCHAGCEAQAVLDALGLTWPDLFPAGHHRGRPLHGIAKQQPMADLVLRALRELGIAYRATRNPRMWVAERCPACGAGERFQLWVCEESGRWPAANRRVALSCANGCEQVAVLDALAKRAGG